MDGAFAGCKNLKKIVLNERLTTLGRKGKDGAFQDSGLEEIYLPSNLRNVTTNTFSGCQNLKTVDIAKSCAVNIESYVGPAVQVWRVTPMTPPASECGVQSNAKSATNAADAKAQQETIQMLNKLLTQKESQIQDLREHLRLSVIQRDELEGRCTACADQCKALQEEKSSLERQLADSNARIASIENTQKAPEKPQEQQESTDK